MPAIIKIACGAASEEALSLIHIYRANELLHDGGTVCTSGFGASLSFSSPGAAILFFLKEEKEKNGGAKTLHSLSTKECGMWKPELLKSV